MNPFIANTTQSSLAIISAMITPAILILASGNLVSSTLTRLGRIVDRARALGDHLAVHGQAMSITASTELAEILRNYRRRSIYAARALSAYYASIGFFIVTSLTIALDNFMQPHVPWLSVALTVIGVLLLLLGTLALVVETNLASGMLGRELDVLGAPKT